MAKKIKKKIKLKTQKPKSIKSYKTDIRKRRKKYNKKRNEYLLKYIDIIKTHNNDLWFPDTNIQYNNINNNTWFTIAEANNINPFNKLNVNIPPPKIKKPKPKNKKNNYDGPRKCIKVIVKFTDKQKQIFDRWSNAYTMMYNETVKYIKNNIKNDKGHVTIKKNDENIRLYILRFENLRTILLKNIKDNIISNSSIVPKKRIKVHIIDTAIKLACANYKAALTNYKRGNIRHFRIRYWKYHRTNRTLEIESSFFKKNTICPQIFGDIETEYKSNGIVSSFDLGLIENNIDYKGACKLQHVFNSDTYYLYVPLRTPKIDLKGPHRMISIDPGIRTFGTGISEGKAIKMGDGISEKIKYYIKKIDLVKDMKLNKVNIHCNNEREDIKKKKNWMKKKKLLFRRKIRNYIDELHWKSINYLTKNFTTILIGDMGIKSIVARDGVLEKMTKKIGLSMRFYEFKQRLKYKCELHNIKYLEVNESYTSKTCSNCGNVDNKLGAKKIYDCKICRKVMDRDINGARGIYIKTHL